MFFEQSAFFIPSLFKQPSYEEPFELPRPIFNNFNVFFTGTVDPPPSRKKPIKKKIKKSVISPQQSSQQTTTDYRKNICRNIMRHAVKSMLSSDNCKRFLKSMLGEPLAFAQYYNKHLEQITGFRVLKSHLIVTPDDTNETVQRKLYFRKYLTWFLADRACLHIVLGEVSNPREYLRYKNEVLLYYV
jgi:hypothetical protein